MRGLALGVARALVFGEAVRRFTELVHSRAEARPLAELEDELATGRPEGFVHAGEHPAQAVCAVDREQPQARGVVARAEGRECFREGLAAKDPALALVEDAEAGIDPRGKGMRTEEPVAEPVDRRDPRAVEGSGEIGSSPLDGPRPNPSA